MTIPTLKGTSWPRICVGCTNAKSEELEQFPQEFQIGSKYIPIEIPATLFLCKDCRSIVDSLSIQEMNRWNKLFKRLTISTVIVVMSYILVLLYIRTLESINPIFLHFIVTSILVVPSLIGALISTKKIRKNIVIIRDESPFLKFIDLNQAVFGGYKFHIANEEFFKIFRRLNPYEKTKLNGEPLKPSLNKEGAAFGACFFIGLVCYLTILFITVLINST